MSTDVMLTVGTIMVGIITAILVAFIPWAYKINGRLTSIEVQLKAVTSDDVRQILRRIEGLLEDRDGEP
jgi:hypothetical protein